MSCDTSVGLLSPCELAVLEQDSTFLMRPQAHSSTRLAGPQRHVMQQNDTQHTAKLQDKSWDDLDYLRMIWAV